MIYKKIQNLYFLRRRRRRRRRRSKPNVLYWTCMKKYAKLPKIGGFLKCYSSAILPPF